MSYTLFEAPTRKAAKPHTCIWCGQPINVLDAYIDERSVYDHQIQRHRWHPECYDEAGEYFKSGEEEFTPWDNERPAPVKTP